jgi:vacuolar-type H+-ATPase subunit H
MPTTTSEKQRASRLAELLACEEELAGLMTAARAEARRRVDAARDEAERAAGLLGASLDEEAERARREIREAARGRADTLLEKARAQVVRFEGVSDAEVGRLAESALRRLIGRA